jgi:hypothetical protein
MVLFVLPWRWIAFDLQCGHDLGRAHSIVALGVAALLDLGFRKKPRLAFCWDFT